MAVSETAAACGKSASGETRTAGANSGSNQALAHVLPAQADIKTIVTSVASACAVWAFASAFSPAHAQIVADTTAAGNLRPLVTTTANGVPQVNIQTPSAAGVSRNVYSQFDVKANGAVLNNSNANVQTQLGGWVQGNSNLAAGNARVILNEVNSSNPSQLNGFVEVAGQRAEVIIANPAGIAVNGGGFINASGVTLTTGAPILNGGNLDGYRVQAGNISFSGAGLDASSTDFTHIIARAVQVNAGIWAKDLKVTTGANEVNAANTTATPIAGTGAAPAFALDVAALGGMYAGKITLIGTEAGVGVNNSGTIGATAGDVVLSNNGWLSNTGSIYASGNTSITTQGNISNTGAGLIAAQGNTSLAAQGVGSQITSTSGTAIAAGMGTTGVIGSTGTLTASASDRMVVNGKIASGADTTLTATALDLSSATLSAQNATLTASAQDINATQTAATVRGTLSAQAHNTLRTDGARINAVQLAVNARDISNVAGVLLQSGTGDLAIATTGNLDNTSGTIATNSTNLTLSAQTLNNTGGHIQHAAGGALRIDTANFNGAGGEVASNGALNLNTGNLNVDHGSTIADQINIHAASINNTGGRIIQTGSAAAVIGVNGAGGVLDNTEGLIHSNGALTITAPRVTNSRTNAVSGQGIVANTLVVNANTITNDTGAIRAAGDLTLRSGGTIDNSQGLISAQRLSIQDTANTPGARTLLMTNTAGVAVATQSNLVQAAGVTGDGQLLSQGNLSLDLTSDFNNSGQVIAYNTAAVNTTGTLTNTGVIDSQGATVLKATTLNNRGAGQIYGNSVAIGVNTLNNAPTVVGGTAPVIAARTGRMDIGVGSLNNQEGALIYSQGDMAIGGSLDGSNQATGRATLVTNNSATMESMGAMDIKTVDLKNTYDSLGYRVEVASAVAGGTSCGADCNVTYTETTYRAVAVEGVNGPGKILAANNLTLDTTGVNVNKESQILAGATLNITGTAVDNQAIEVVLNKEQRGTAAQRYTWTTCYPCEEHADYNYSAYSNDIPDNQFISRGVATTGSAIASVTLAGAQTVSSVSAGTAQNPAALLSIGQVSAPVTLPNSSLFKINSNPTSLYLVETDPRFTSMHAWLGSDYMLRNIALDPSVTQKRLGDGFYEQRLINEQVSQLTGRRFFGNFTSDEQQYQALMDAGVTYAQAFQLRPGIALSAAQVAQLTSDIVWLVEKEVTLKDGSKQRALVPQVYAMVREGDLANSGALLSGNNVNISTTGGITNNGTILGRQLVHINAQTVNNLGGGLIQGDAVNASARQDINILGGSVLAQSALTVNAGRDLNVQSTTRQTTNDTGRVKTSNQAITRVAGLYVTKADGTLLASAGNDANLIAAAIQSAGNATIAAGNNVNLKTVTQSSSLDATIDANNFNRNSQSAEVGTSIQSAGNATITAGNNITARAAQVQAKGELIATAGNSVAIEAGQATRSDSSGRTTSGSSFVSSSTTTDRTASSSTQAIGSDLGGKNVAIRSGNSIGVKGSSVIADQDLTLTAANNVTIEAAQNTSRASTFHQKSESGLMSNGGLSISVGEREQSTDQGQQSTSAAASTVGSVGGHVNITAGKQYTQTGSDVMTPEGDVNITAKKVNIVEARETSASQTESKFKQSGITISLQSSALQAAQTVQAMDQASQNTSNKRMKALGAASAALALTQAMSDPTPQFSASIGSSENQSNSTSQSNTARGSSIAAGGKVSIAATGDGANSDLTIQGSTVKAGDSVNLRADNNVNLLAAANTSSQTSSQSSSSSSAGVSLGKNIGVTVSASHGSGDGNGQDVSYAHTRIDATNNVNISSGSDTTLKGALVKADTVKAQVGGNLNIESLQDKSNYTEQSRSEGGSVTIGPKPGGSISLGKTNIDSNYTSVVEQSAIQAGDGGFQVKVNGDTDLKGGAITSTQKAIDDNKNKFQTAKLTTGDLNNSASYSAESYQVTVGSSGGSAGIGQDSGKASSTTQAAISGIAGNQAARTGDKEAGIAKIFDQAQVSKEVNAQVAITQSFGQQAAKAVGDYAQSKTAPYEDARRYKDLKGQAILTDQERSTLAQMEGKGYTMGTADAALANPENLQAYKDWKEGGSSRVLMHTAIGALTGGAAGAAGAGTIASAAPLMDDLQNKLNAALVDAGVNPKIAEALSKTALQGTALVVGSAAGGAQGGMIALNVDANNRQLHETEAQKLSGLKQGKSQRERDRLDAAACALVQCASGVPESDPNYQKLAKMQSDGAQYTDEIKTLRATGEFVYQDVFDPARDALTRNAEITKRAGGAVNLAGGALGTVSGVAIASVSAVACPETLVSCAAVPLGVGIAVASNQQAQDGNKAMVGSFQSTEGQRVLDSFDPKTYPGERDPLKEIGVDAAKLGFVLVAGKYIPKVLANVEGLEAKAATGTSSKSASTGKPDAMLPDAELLTNTPSGKSELKVGAGANGTAGVPAGTSIPANSANAGVGLRNDLSIQAGVPTSTSNVWGASLDDLKQAFNTGGATITPGSARASSSGNAQILNVEGSSTGVVRVQYSPASTKSDHAGQYYKFTYADGSELKVIDPATYRVLGWPEKGGKTTFQNPSGKVITFDPVTKTWR